MIYRYFEDRNIKLSKYADRIKAQLIRNCEERARAYEATEDERRQLYDEFLKPRESVIDTSVLIVSKNHTESDI